MSSRLLHDNEIRGRFRELRERLGWSVTEAAAELGSNQSTVTQWEQGKRPIPQKYRKAIARRAGEAETYLITTEDADAVSREVRDRLIAADWMHRMADRLREEALATPPPESDEGAPEEHPATVVEQVQNGEGPETTKAKQQQRRKPRKG